MPAQEALRRMGIRILHVPAVQEMGIKVGCTATALHYFESRGRPNAMRMGQLSSRFSRHPQAMAGPEGTTFGLPFSVTEKLYAKEGLEFASALVDARSFPRDCILQMAMRHDTSEGHVAAVVGGTVLDTFDCRQKDYVVTGYFVPKAKVSRSGRELVVKNPPRRQGPPPRRGRHRGRGRIVG